MSAEVEQKKKDVQVSHIPGANRSANSSKELQVEGAEKGGNARE